MKLIDYISEYHGGNAAAFAKKYNYHITQVRRCIKHEGLIDKDKKPYFKKYLNEASNA